MICLGVLLAYANSLTGPFVFDDLRGIVNNESIRKLWPLNDALNPPMHATGAGGRPIVNLSLAVNYAIGGLDVRGYHVFNMMVHGLVALVLMGFVRRTLMRPVLSQKFAGASLPLSFAVALLWALHPLQTESVTCVIQRSESLGGLFYLLTLYAFVRSIEGEKVRCWQIICVGVCLIGMATKEFIATVPVIALLYDRTFVAGTFKVAWQQRWRFYCGLMSTWLLLAYLVIVNESRAGMVGFGLGMSSWDYALTQCRAIVMYLKLSLWPSPLVLDYGSEVVTGLGEVWLQGVLLLVLVVATFVALVRKPVLGFVAFTFFSILAPSSSFIPLTTQTIAEHRMYLPLAGVLVLVVLGFYARLGKRVIPYAVALAVIAGIATAYRNQDYRTTTSIWSDTVEKSPDNPRARLNLGSSFSAEGRLEAALREFKAALRLDPQSAITVYNIGNVYLRMERFEEATKHYTQAIELDPDYGMAHYGLGCVLISMGRIEDSLAHFERAKELVPNNPTVLHSFASSLAHIGRLEEAMEHYDQVISLKPNDPVVHSEIGILLFKLKRYTEALPYFETALRINPRDARIRYRFAQLLMRLERYQTAARELVRVLRVRPNFPEGRNNLGIVLLELGQLSDAAAQFKEALRLKPDYAEAQRNLYRAEMLYDSRR